MVMSLSYKQGHVFLPNHNRTKETNTDPLPHQSLASLQASPTVSIMSFIETGSRGESHVEFSHHVFLVACNLDEFLGLSFHDSDILKSTGNRMPPSLCSPDVFS